MNIQNTQTPKTPPSLETLVNLDPSKQPAPEVPPNLEEIREKEAAEKQVETEKTNLSNTETIALKAKSTQDKIDAYKAGMDGAEVKSEQQKTMDSVQEFKNLQEDIQQQKGHQTYAAEMGLS